MRERSRHLKRLCGALLLIITIGISAVNLNDFLTELPDFLTLSQGQAALLPRNALVSVRCEGAAAAIASGDETLVRARANGEGEVTFSLMGLFPLGKTRVSVAEGKLLVPGGAAVGVAFRTAGVLVVGMSSVSGERPAEKAGIRAGDLIEKIDGQPVQTAEELTAHVEKAGASPLVIEYSRDGARKIASVTPGTDERSGEKRLGVWVRDSTAGVGTLSFYDPDTGAFGALGHPIADADTGLTLPISSGSLLSAEIVDVRKGEKGEPGELRGSFLRRQEILGSLSENGAFGVYGALDSDFMNPLYPNGLPVGGRDGVRAGKASILCCVEGEEIREYEIEITQVSRQSSPAPRGLTLRVTDAALLSQTGGVVQGMSGSPIIQDGRIVGAVTHVFVNDPTQGYGIFIEWMLEQSGKIDKAA